ncbi:MAG: hypothetical protein OXS30_05415 [Chloroflexota bacterium]|nr:hypothetical protein [Chloroflexota bacterium]
MSFPLNYRKAMTKVAELAMDGNTAAYVRERLLRTLVQELSPLNQRHTEVKRELGIEEAPAEAFVDAGVKSRAYMQGVRDGMAAAQIEAAEAAERSEEEDEDDGDDESGGVDEDEPP